MAEQMTAKVHELESFGSALLQRYGINENDADRTSDILVEADRAGTGSHGIRMLTRYIPGIQHGDIKPTSQPKYIRSKSLTLVDADFQIGPSSAEDVLISTIESAQKHGSAVTVVHNANHYGAGHHYAARAAIEGFYIEIRSNSNALAAAPGGKKPVLGANALTMGLPANYGGEIIPVVSDYATTVVAFNLIRKLAASEEPIPKDLLLDRNGEPTTDPEDVKGGFLCYDAMGGYGYKLSNQSLFTELLLLGLGGEACLDIPTKPHGGTSSPVSWYFKAMDIEQLSYLVGLDLEDFQKRVGHQLTKLKESGPNVLFPGEPELKNLRKNKDTVNLDVKIIEDLDALGKEGGIELKLS